MIIKGNISRDNSYEESALLTIHAYAKSKARMVESDKTYHEYEHRFPLLLSSAMHSIKYGVISRTIQHAMQTVYDNNETLALQRKDGIACKRVFYPLRTHKIKVEPIDGMNEMYM